MVKELSFDDFLAMPEQWPASVPNAQPGFYASSSWYRAVQWSMGQEHVDGTVLTIDIDGARAAVIPLTYRRTRNRIGESQQLEIAGNIYSPRRYVLGSESLAKPVAAAFREWLQRKRGRWDVFRWDDAHLEDPFFRAFEGELQHVSSVYVDSGEHNVFTDISIDADAEEFFRSLSKNTKNNMNRAVSRLAREFDTKLCRFSGDAPEFSTAIQHYYDIYAKSWKEPERFPTFHKQLPQQIDGQSEVLLYVLYVRPRDPASEGFKLSRASMVEINPKIGEDYCAIAAYYFVKHERTAHFLKTAYDEAFKQVSPGTALLWFSLRDLIDNEGARTVDYQKGEERYKSKLGNRTEPRGRLTAISARSPLIRLEHWLRKQKQSLSEYA